MQKCDKELREKIEAIGTVPAAFQFDAMVSWQKMENLLQPIKQKKKAVLFYWSAAAMLIIAASCFLLFKEMPINKENNKLVLQKHPIPKEVVETAKNKLLNQEQTPNKSLSSKLANEPIKSNQPINDIVIVQSNIIQPENSIATAPSIDSLITLPLVSVQKTLTKRLKIIHLSQLDEPEPISIAQAKQSKKIALENAEDDAPVNTGTKNWWLFKTRSNNNSSQPILQ